MHAFYTLNKILFEFLHLNFKSLNHHIKLPPYTKPWPTSPLRPLQTKIPITFFYSFQFRILHGESLASMLARRSTRWPIVLESSDSSARRSALRRYRDRLTDTRTRDSRQHASSFLLHLFVENHRIPFLALNNYHEATSSKTQSHLLPSR